MSNDYVAAILQGGLGNQLFILAAGLQQARRLGVELRLEIWADSLSVDRPLALPEESLPLGVRIVRIDTHLSGPRRWRLRMARRLSRQLYVENSSDCCTYSSDIEHIRPGDRLVGFFQSWRYFHSVQEEMRAFLDKVIHDTVPASDRVGTPQHEIAVHVRRGDYMTSHALAYHGICSDDYYRRATNLLGARIGSRDVVVYSDQPHLSLDLDLDWRLAGASENESAWCALDRMSSAAGLVMANSSLSWWAAWRMSWTGQRPVVAPEPWFTRSDIPTKDLLLGTWSVIPR